MDNKIIPTSIRVPEKFLNDIKQLADSIGDSQNGMMLNLMYMGMKVYDGKVSTTLLDQE